MIYVYMEEIIIYNGKDKFVDWYLAKYMNENFVCKIQGISEEIIQSEYKIYTWKEWSDKWKKIFDDDHKLDPSEPNWKSHINELKKKGKHNE